MCSRVCLPLCAYGRCAANAQPTAALVATAAMCEAVAEPSECSATKGCTFCKSVGAPVASKCYSAREAAVLLHVIPAEALGAFECM